MDNPETPEEQTARELRAAEEETKKAAARARSKSNLLDFLTPGEIACLDNFDSVLVHGEQYSYLIPSSYCDKIVQFKRDEHGFLIPVERLCVHVQESGVIPVYDNILTLKLAIQTQEKVVLATANKWGLKDSPELKKGHEIARLFNARKAA
jgi:hypothetical protein